MEFAPSAHYDRALAESAAHHASSKTFSGMFLRPHALPIKALIDRYGARTVLDYGAGKGRQYEWRSHSEQETGMPVGWTLERFWGVHVTKYDPAWPPFAAEPVGQFDLVLCTHTLGCIPTADVAHVIDRLYSLARHAVYVAEKIGERKKKVFSDPLSHPAYSREDWAWLLKSRLALTTRLLDVTLATREVGPTGIDARRMRITP